MADGERDEKRSEGPAVHGVPRRGQPEPRQADIQIEMRDSLPGDRAVIAVEREGCFTWVASRRYVHPKAVEEFRDQLQQIVRQGMWVQNWTGRRSA
jgi:hypothetical protein